MRKMLSEILDKRGRRFTKGHALRGRDGIMVSGITRIGNFVQVDFSRVPGVPGDPPLPVVQHVDDLEDMRE